MNASLESQLPQLSSFLLSECLLAVLPSFPAASLARLWAEDYKPVAVALAGLSFKRMSLCLFFHSQLLCPCLLNPVALKISPVLINCNSELASNKMAPLRLNFLFLSLIV